MLSALRCVSIFLILFFLFTFNEVSAADPLARGRIGFNHNATGFLLSGGHARASCEGCHINGVFKGTPTQCGVCHVQGGRASEASKPSRHIPTKEKCDTCHKTTGWLPAKFSHMGVVGSCISCHDNTHVSGKSSNHVQTTQPCETCHKNTTSFKSGTMMNHTGIVTGCANCHTKDKPASGHIPTTLSCENCHSSASTFSTQHMNHLGISSGCATCHSGGFANVTVKIANHIPTTLSCENCHSSTSTFSTQRMNHLGISSGCATCHGGGFANVTVKIANHVPTTLSCENCHLNTTSFTAPNKPNHALLIGATCRSCHGYNFAGVVSGTHHPPRDCGSSGCHNTNTFTM